MMSSILIINPNSTIAMTKALEPLITPLLPASITAEYYTGPPSSPPSINNHSDMVASTNACLPQLLPHLSTHSAFLVACFSDHPLTNALRTHTKKPVVGIFEAAIFHTLALLGSSPTGMFSIVTTGKAWEPLLTQGAEALLGGRKRLGGVESTGLDADQLHHADDVEERMRCASKRAVGVEGVEVLVLGCAGMVGMEVVVRGAAREVKGREGTRVVDGVKAGVKVLVGMLGMGYED